MWDGKGLFLAPAPFGEPSVIDRVVAVGSAGTTKNEGDNDWGEASVGTWHATSAGKSTVIFAPRFTVYIQFSDATCRVPTSLAMYLCIV
ncbi:hypothetical protein HMPREF3034_02100 [Prevotella sp. DNF00663]|uniref:hypothetical protein n=1 Tax=Prevotella sp. DNF00663 TaxID=1384078 RepID=UPI0007860787|nr:hypothetical protein [Prevotella sp. DNF00663]KXB79628.1 hypothetical protein HMPREF3034_02100 [Prevotella sp. DNF00663]